VDPLDERPHLTDEHDHPPTEAYVTATCDAELYQTVAVAALLQRIDDALRAQTRVVAETLAFVARAEAEAAELERQRAATTPPRS
jgi:hypothetical protein